MGKPGCIKIRLNPVDAAMVADWAEAWHPSPSLFNMWPTIGPNRENEYPPKSLATFFRKFAVRASSQLLQERQAEMPRDLGIWLADRVHHRAGMFAAFSLKPTLPLPVEYVCAQCELRVYYASRGRKWVRGDLLRQRLSQAVCERHLKRLKKRLREEEATPKSLFAMHDKKAPN